MRSLVPTLGSGAGPKFPAPGPAPGSEPEMLRAEDKSRLRSRGNLCLRAITLRAARRTAEILRARLEIS
ncbi:unnamed protein product [Bursaphelenchus xylophilus]|uniref:(pine wood nematode) hypothetical protein n=1 Tax=Bursaphelenchus xylophilus TaxID=6326 RepID=A0A1I7RW49_BURXY|nr:unnamed protein product [Bursaphelenchus xylophilus]CAG9095125.1 unnamed protein product [Bursaphelenchus xylophilus]